MSLSPNISAFWQHPSRGLWTGRPLMQVLSLTTAFPVGDSILCSGNENGPSIMNDWWLPASPSGAFPENLHPEVARLSSRFKFTQPTQRCLPFPCLDVQLWCHHHVTYSFLPLYNHNFSEGSHESPSTERTTPYCWWFLLVFTLL